VPDVGGCEFPEVFRKKESWQDVPDGWYTAMAGCGDYDTRPVELAHLLEKINTLLNTD